MHTRGFCSVPAILMGVTVPLPLWVRCSRVRVRVQEKKPEGYPCHTLLVEPTVRLKMTRHNSQIHDWVCWRPLVLAPSHNHLWALGLYICRFINYIN